MKEIVDNLEIKTMLITQIERGPLFVTNSLNELIKENKIANDLKD